MKWFVHLMKVIINMSLVKYDYIINEYNFIIKTIIDKWYNISPFYIKTGDNNIIRTSYLIDEYYNLINVSLVIEFCEYKNNNVYYLITKLCVRVIQYTNNNCDENIIYENVFYKCKDIECNRSINNKLLYYTSFDEAINFICMK